jgi:hypothetical protein
MADGIERETKFRDAASVLIDDAGDVAKRLKSYLRSGEYGKAEALAGSLQRTARDAKWLIRRLPKKD